MWYGQFQHSLKAWFSDLEFSFKGFDFCIHFSSRKQTECYNLILCLQISNKMWYFKTLHGLINKQVHNDYPGIPVVLYSTIQHFKICVLFFKVNNKNEGVLELYWRVCFQSFLKSNCSSVVRPQACDCWGCILVLWRYFSNSGLSWMKVSTPLTLLQCIVGREIFSGE